MPLNWTPQTTCDAGPLSPSLTDVCNAAPFFVFISLLNTLIRNNTVISGKCERVRPVEKPKEIYDFVVVGGGGAGAVVAARLSENPKIDVLLLEAGPDEPAGAQVPGFATRFLETKMVWDYATTNEPNACLGSNGSCIWNHGKNLGGNTAHNALIYIRGHPSDYNYWAEQGNEGWSWNDVKKYFLKNENNGEIERVGTEDHATGGPLPVERFPYTHPFGLKILDAATQTGYPISDDLNGDVRTGFSLIQGMQKKGVRHSSARSYLWPIRNRKNLHISLNSQVTKVIIEGDTAVGVEYSKNGKQHSVYATKEVILSGGVVESPHLLLLSGIGPKEHLESVGVKVVKDLPGVGENLHDHPCAILALTIDEPDTFDNDWVTAMEYVAYQNGSLSSIGPGVIVGMLETSATTANRPDIEVYFYSYVSNCATGEIGGLQSSGKRPLYILPSYLYPKSRGKLTLASTDPFEHPVILSNYLNHPDDVKAMVAGIKMSLALLATKALQPYNISFADVPIGDCAKLTPQTDEFWACIASLANYALHHEGGTCKMGNSSDPMAVVDDRLRVYGIKGLRVVDNSIMPMIPAGNTASPAMMIGEKASDMIKEDWCRKSHSNSRHHGHGHGIHHSGRPVHC